MSTLNRIKEYIGSASDETLISRKWDIRHKSYTIRDAYGRMYPAGRPYFFEANPSFLIEYANFLDMERYPLIMVRDGLVTVAEFFLKNPTPPKGLSTIFLVPEEFEGFVPRGWEGQVAFYKVQVPTWSGKAPKRVVIFGNLISYSFWLKKPEETFEDLRALIPKSTAVEFFLPIRERSVFMSLDESDYISKGLSLIQKHFGDAVKIHTDNNKILDLKLGEGDAFCHMADAPFLVYDDYFTHWCSAQNIPQLGRENVSGNDSLEYKLSLYHSVRIREMGPEAGKKFGDYAIKAKMKGVKIDVESSDFHQFIRQMQKNAAS